MRNKQKTIILFCINLLLVFFHLYHKSKLVTLNHSLQTLITQKNHIIAQKNDRQLMFEQLRNPRALAQQAKEFSMEKIRLSTIKPLPQATHNAFPTL